jgi:WD domain, G-beta repeat
MRCFWNAYMIMCCHVTLAGSICERPEQSVLAVQIKLWDARSGTHVCTYHGHQERVNCVRFSWNGNWLLSGSKDTTCKLFELRMNRELQRFLGHTKEVNTVAWHPLQESLFVTGGADDAILHWFVDSEHAASTAKDVHGGSVNCVAWHPVGHMLTSVGYDATVKFWTRSRPGDVLLGHLATSTLGPNQQVEAAPGTHAPAKDLVETPIPGLSKPVPPPRPPPGPPPGSPPAGAPAQQQQPQPQPPGMAASLPPQQPPVRPAVGTAPAAPVTGSPRPPAQSPAMGPPRTQSPAQPWTEPMQFGTAAGMNQGRGGGPDPPGAGRRMGEAARGRMGAQARGRMGDPGRGRMGGGAEFSGRGQQHSGQGDMVGRAMGRGRDLRGSGFVGGRFAQQGPQGGQEGFDGGYAGQGGGRAVRSACCPTAGLTACCAAACR